jgi:hypothetical protein
MAKQLIDVGVSANDGTGDTLRSGAVKVNNNFDEVYSALESSFNITASGASAYTFQADTRFFITNENNPVLYLQRGRTYNFIVNASGHPLEIRLSNGGGAYNTGVSNNADDAGTVIFTPTMSAPSTLYYQCTNHPAMGNTINII